MIRSLRLTLLIFFVQALLIPSMGQMLPTLGVDSNSLTRGQDFPQKKLAYFWSESIPNHGSPWKEIREAHDEIQTLLQEWSARREKYKKEAKFLKKIFGLIHRKYLKRYRQYSTLREVFEKKNYDCVSGTSLYALVFEYLGQSYQIKETPFHTYLILNLENSKRILIESTSPRLGWVRNENQIREMEHYFTWLDHQEFYGETLVFNRTITLRQLAGLQYYNQAVDFYNRKEFEQAKQYLRQATRLYETKRIKRLAKLIEIQVSQRNSKPKNQH